MNAGKYDVRRIIILLNHFNKYACRFIQRLYSIVFYQNLELVNIFGFII